MRLLLVFSMILILLSCSKNRKVVNRIEGTWRLTDLMLNDGSHIYPGEIHVFEKGAYGGKEYARWTRYTADYSDTTAGSYFVVKKGNEVILRNDESAPVQADTCRIDDMDKNMLIIRSNLGVMYLYKE
jgi:hypothetical protein